MKLTREQIENMPAGIEMDLVVTQEVMGLDIYDSVEWREWAWKHNELSYPCGFYDEFGVFIVKAEGTMGKYFSPSNDIAAAFEALYKWLDNNKTYAVHIETVNIKTGRIYDVILWGMDDQEVYDARAKDLPLAICRVLIATLEAE